MQYGIYCTVVAFDLTTSRLQFCLYLIQLRNSTGCTIHNNESYRIAGKFGGELNLALWRIDQPTAKLKIRQYLIRVYTYVRIYVYGIDIYFGRPDRPPARHSRIIMGLGQAHERELIVNLSCFLTCMLGGVTFYYYLPCRYIDSSPKLACHRECHRWATRKSKTPTLHVDSARARVGVAI